MGGTFRTKNLSPQNIFKCHNYKSQLLGTSSIYSQSKQMHCFSQRRRRKKKKKEEEENENEEEEEDEEEENEHEESEKEEEEEKKRKA